MEQKYIKSPLNYIGGKHKLLPQLLPLFPKEINIFVDLFCGGCNVGLNVNAKKYIFNDNLTYLIDLYENFKNFDFDNILSHIKYRIEEYQLTKHNEIGYNSLRSKYNKHKDSLDLFVLLCYSFNHQIRFNSKHEFNTSFGKERSQFNEKIENNLKEFKNRINEIDLTITNQDFNDFDIDMLGKDDFVYLDPPYLISTGSYNDGKRGFKDWSEKEEVQLLSLIVKLNEKNVKFGLSNVIKHKGQENRLLRDFLKENNFNVHYLNFNYDNSNYQSNKSETLEIFVKNF